MTTALTEFLGILVGGIQTLATGVAEGVITMAKTLFLEIDDGAVVGLSIFGGIVALFAGISLAVAITSKVYMWVTSLGAK